jgi:hypothetical protein
MWEGEMGIFYSENQKENHLRDLGIGGRITLSLAYWGFAWLIERDLDSMIEFIGSLYKLLQHFTDHYLRQDTLDFWPLYTNPLLNYSNWTVSQSQSYFTTGGLPPIHSSWRQLFWTSRYIRIASGALHSKHIHCLAMASTIVAYCCKHYLTTGCLPRICLRRNVFIELLPSNGPLRHNIKHKCRDLVLQFGVWTQGWRPCSVKKKYCYQIQRNENGMTNLAETSKEGYGSKRAVLTTTII